MKKSLIKNDGNYKVEFYLDGFLSKKVETEIKRQYISFIKILERLIDEGKITEDDFFSFRKQILDSGNASIRSIQEQIALIFSNLKLNGEFLINEKNS